MVNRACGADDPVSAESRAKLRDAQSLKAAMCEAISTSPEAFLATIAELEAKEDDYWEREIRSSTWAVLERADEIVGFAVARSPNGEADNGIDPAAARFIESVWIAPELRGNRMAERLVRFLVEVEVGKSPDLRQFLLWVFDKNIYAIRLYERMGFRYVNQKELDDDSGRIELRYEYWLEPDAGGARAALSARQDDLHAHGVVYRVLGEDTG
jgi:ribosomal protein S18 acetylase RimI-like enzyme